MNNTLAEDFRHFHRQRAFLGGAIDVFSNKSPSAAIIYRPLFMQIDRFLQNLRRSSPLFDQLMEHLHLGIIASNKPNAFIWRKCEEFYVGITSGFVHLLFETAFASLSDNDCFSLVEDNYGNTHSKKISKTALQQYFLHEDDKAIMYRHNSFPDNQLRADIAGALFSDAIIFTLMHEISHCLMGQLERINMGPDMISEVIDPLSESTFDSNLRFFRSARQITLVF
jgi:hypothetical protein